MVYQDYLAHLDLKAKQVYQVFQAFPVQKASQVWDKQRFYCHKNDTFSLFL
jgi:hypothetical protein